MWALISRRTVWPFIFSHLYLSVTARSSSEELAKEPLKGLQSDGAASGQWLPASHCCVHPQFDPDHGCGKTCSCSVAMHHRIHSIINQALYNYTAAPHTQSQQQHLLCFILSSPTNKHFNYIIDQGSTVCQWLELSHSARSWVQILSWGLSGWNLHVFTFTFTCDFLQVLAQ